MLKFISDLIARFLKFIKNLRGKETTGLYEYVRIYPTTTNFKTQIIDWQQRELAQLPNKNKQLTSEYKFDLNKVQEIFDDMRESITYISDLNNYGVSDYWATSSEVMKTKKDDCDGQAVYMWRKLRDAGFPDDLIGMVYIYGHIFTCVYESNNSDFWILGALKDQTTILKCSEVFPLVRNDKYYYPVFGFNVFDHWDYQRKSIT